MIHTFLESKTEIQVHEKCRTKYLISNKNTPGSLNSSVSGISTRSVSSDFEFSKHCLFCQKDVYNKFRKKHIIQSDEIKEKLLQFAEQRYDSLGQHVIDLISRINSLTEVK